MAASDLQHNLRLLCSYGKSTSDICRRAGFNRQQFNKYLNGHAEPSLATLRRICDFFGVEEHEIHLPRAEFQAIVRLRPPMLGGRTDKADRVAGALWHITPEDLRTLETHQGYYHTYYVPEPARGHITRCLTHIYRKGDRWLAKSIERDLSGAFLVPRVSKFEGLVLASARRLTIVERETGSGQGIWTHMLYCAEQEPPGYLSGLHTGIESESRHLISCIRTVWHYLGTAPDLRHAIASCGVVDPRREALPDIVLELAQTSLGETSGVFSPL